MLKQWDAQTIKNEIKEKNNITLLGTIIGFSNYLFIEGKAKSTAEAYITDIKQFDIFLKVNLSNKIRYVNQITRVELEQYKHHLLEKLKKSEFGNKTVERKYNSIKVYFKFLNHCYGISNITLGDKFGNKNSVRNWNDNYESNILPPIIPSHEIDSIFSAIYSSNDKNIFRDTAILELLIGIGCRKSELLEFRWSDIDFHNNEILIRRKKTRNSDLVKLNQKSKKALATLWSLNPTLYSNSYIFKGRNDESSGLSPSALHAVVKKWVNNSGVNPKISAHYFRHTFITNCIKQGIQNEKIIKYTGHSAVEGLKPYVHLISEDTIDVANTIDKLRGA